MIIVFGSIKGGVGKSTLSASLAADLLKCGKRVALVDADRQGSTASWHEYRSNTQRALPDLYQMTGNIADDLVGLADSGRYDFVIVDTAGRASKELISAMVVADLLLSPVAATQIDLDSLPELLSQVQTIRKQNPRLKAKILQTMGSTHAAVKADEREAFCGYVEAVGFDMCETVIRYRTAYRQCVVSGAGVTEYPDRKAASEVSALVKELEAVA